MDMLHRYRETAAWIALGSLALMVLSGLVDIAALNAWPGGGLELPEVARVVDSRFAPVVTMVVAALVCWFSLFWQTPSRRAHAVALTGLVLTGASALLHVVFTLIGWGSENSGGLGIVSSLMVMLANLAAMGLVAGFFWIGLKHVAPVPAPAPASGGWGQVSSGAANQHYPAQQYPGQQPPVPRAPQQPAWQPGEASGGAWHRAGDAATGASASSWGVPGEQAQGWQPSASHQPSAPQPWPHADKPQGQQQWEPQPRWAGQDEGAEDGTILRPNPNPQRRPEDPGQR